MKVIVTEKPSVAREIASVFGISSRQDGYITGKGCAVTWAFGHLVTLQEPHEYDPALRRWAMHTLPFIPSTFRLKLITGKGVKKQFQTIQRLLGGADDIICATDAGREGELIFRYVLDLAGFADRPFRRLWLNALTPAAVREAFGQLKEHSAYERLYAAARCRNEADWVVGLNATRCFTVSYGQAAGGNRVLWSIGRVQTPVLAMIVERDDEVADFEPRAFWELATRYREALFKYAGDRFDTAEQAATLLEQVKDQPFTITGITGSRKTERPPQLYDLTSLQRDMNKRHHMAAAQTLELAQMLYERKHLTYPRTDSRYINNSMKEQVVRTLRALEPVRAEQVAQLDPESLPFTKRIVDDAKVTDHHAILPTDVLPRGLEPAARKVWDAVVTQFIAAFYPDCRKQLTTVEGVSAEVPFRAKGTVVLQPGWTALFPSPQKDENDQALPVFKKGESGPHEPFSREGKTKPPKRFTENSLLSAMESAGKLVEDEVLREALKERGIGTPATRAAIIETLLKRNYIRREKKHLAATDMGFLLISLIKDSLLKSPEMTGEWEEKLKKIERGLLAPEAFSGEIEAYTRQLIEAVRGFSVDRTRWGACPLCGAEVMAGKRGYGCSLWREGCSFVLWRDYKGMVLSERTVRELLQHGLSLDAVHLPEAGQRALRLSKRGTLRDLACPRREEQGFREDGKSRRRSS